MPVDSIALVLLVPFATAIALALLREHPRLEARLNALSCLGLTAFVAWLARRVDTDGIAVTNIGGWAAPYGIALVADRLSCIMLCLSMGVASVVALYAIPTVTPVRQRYFFYPLFQILLLGVNWSLVTGDLFNLFVAYEVMLIGSYGAMMVGGSPRQVRQGLTYVALNLLGGSLFVVGIGLVYALVGTLNMADIARLSAGLEGERAAMLTAATSLLLVVFALKASAFPLFSWLPDSYPVVPAGMNGYFAGLLTKVGVYSLLRVFVMTFRQPGNEFLLRLLLVSAGFTMLLGVLGALCQWEIRRILSWHIISQVGYMLMGIGLAAEPAVATAAVAATILYVAHNVIVKSSLFLVGDVAAEIVGSDRLKEMGGVAAVAPVAGAFFLASALSIAGLPPFSGFLAKLTLVRVGISAGAFGIVLVAVATSFLTLLSMMKIWTYGFWGDPREGLADEAGSRWRAMVRPVAVLVAATVVLGVVAQPFLRFADGAAAGLTDPSAYVAAVLGPEAGAPRIAALDTGKAER